MGLKDKFRQWRGKSIPQEASAEDDADLFAFCVKDRFSVDKETAQKIFDTLYDLQIPIPRKIDEFCVGSDGLLIFDNRHGVVVRIEVPDQDSCMKAERVNDNPFVLQPLAGFTAGRATIEICPGCRATREIDEVNDLDHMLGELGINYKDKGLANNGRFPIETGTFPYGVPVVIDRLAVARLENAVIDVQTALKKAGLECDPQEMLYGNLRRALAEAWPQGQDKPDPEKMMAFWQLCAEKKQEGVLVTGWMDTTKYYGDPGHVSEIYLHHFDMIGPRQRYNSGGALP